MILNIDNDTPVELGIQDESISLRTGEVVNIGTSDYEELDNKPQINDIELVGDLSSEDIGVADRVHTHTKSQITDLPSLAIVATSGDYNDLMNKPVIPEKNLYIVNITYDPDEDEYKLVNMTFQNICEAYDNGKALILIYTDEDDYSFEYVLSNYAEDDGFVSFSASFSPSLVTTFTVNEDNTVDYIEVRARTSELTNDSLFTRGYSAVWRGTCATGASTATKYVNCASFLNEDQDIGVIVFVTFQYTNSASVSDLKLNVQNRGAKPVKCLKAGQLSDLDSPNDLSGTMPFFYDGTNWVTLYDTSEENTDENVKQTSPGASGYSYWRPLVIGKSSSGTEGFTPSTSTGETFAFNTLEAQPSTGTIRMGTASMYKGSYTSKLSPDTLTGNRAVTIPDKSGTLAMEDDIPTKTSDLQNDSLFARGNVAVFNGTCDSGASAVEKAVTCADFKAGDLVPGAMILVSFAETNSGAVADLKLNVNNTGAYPIKQNKAGAYSNLDGAGYLKTGNTYPFVFNGSYWVTWYNTDTNTIGYNIRTNSLSLPMKSTTYRYRLLFTSADGNNYVPANTSSSTSATASKTVNQDPIDPFGRIVYYATTAQVSAGSRPSVTYQYQQYYTITLGYSFNRTGQALTLTAWKPVYLKCSPQADGSAVMDSSTPIVQDRPTTNDGYIYIFLGVAISATAIELTLEHPVYYHDGTALRLWTGPVS